MAVQRRPVVGGFFILLQLITITLPFRAFANLPQLLYSGDFPLKLPTDDPRGPAVSGGSLHRSQFPKDFIFGSGTSAYQVEGAASRGNKGISVWDTWTHTPGRVVSGETGDVADDQYDRFEEDIDLMAAMNFDSYRFSIGWTRIFPNGTGPHVNKEGVAYYNRVIDTLLSRGIKPFVTLYHWDLPQALQDSYGGWLSDQIIGDFAKYAAACFEAFGDRVKHWTTMNEPSQFAAAYGEEGGFPPGWTAHPSTGPYLAAHNALLAHAAAVDVYRKQFKAEQEGVIGISLEVWWGEPLTNSTEDIEAAIRYVLCQVGWFLDPLYFGDYPDVMRQNVGNRLPQFSENQVALLKGSLDFIGLNEYTARWVSNGADVLPEQESSVSLDQHVTITAMKDGQPIGPMAGGDWFYIVPWSLENLLKWTSERYNIPIYITENGMSDSGYLDIEDTLHDTTRVQFFHDYISSVLRAVRDGVDVRGYFAWSLLDNYEWTAAYTIRYGLIYVDRLDGLKRYPRDSARWFSQLLHPTSSES